MRSLAQPAFPDDDGRADPALATALEQHTQHPDPAAVLAALSRARLLVPVVALRGADPDEADGGADKEADMSAVLMQGRDGRRALLAFSSLQHLTRWDKHARPAPVSTADAARAAAAEDAAAILLDVAGPVSFVVSGDDLAVVRLGDAGDLTVSRSEHRPGEPLARPCPRGVRHRGGLPERQLERLETVTQWCRVVVAEMRHAGGHQAGE
jgi:hypothetical protein